MEYGKVYIQLENLLGGDDTWREYLTLKDPEQAEFVATALGEWSVAHIFGWIDKDGVEHFK